MRRRSWEATRKLSAADSLRETSVSLGLARDIAILARMGDYALRGNQRGKMKNTNRCGLGACAIIGSLVWAIGTVSAQEGSAQQDPAASEPAPVVASKSFRLAVENSATLAGGLSVQLNKSFLREGDALVVTVDVPRDGYLYVVSVGPDDVATVLFPNQQQRDNQVSVGQVTIPTEQMKFDLKVTKPHGATVVAAFLSKEALDVAKRRDHPQLLHHHHRGQRTGSPHPRAYAPHPGF